MEEAEESDMAVLGVEPVQSAEALRAVAAPAVVPAAAHAASLAVAVALAR